MEPGGTGSYLHYLIVGLGWTLVTALAAWVIALLLGAFVGTVRTTTKLWAVRVGNLYVEIFRNIPLIVRARAMQEFSFRVFEAFTAATVIYLLTNLIVVLLMRAIENKVRVPGLIAAGGAPQAGH